MAGAGKTYTIGKCPKCDRFRLHVIEKKKQEPAQ